MNFHLTSITAVVVVASVQMASAADLTGKVKLNGTPPPEKPIQMDAVCGKLNSKPETTRHYVVGSDKGLANTFVYVKAGAAKTPAKSEPEVLDQVGCMYHPYVLGAVTDQEVKIRNSDSLLHNVHAIPKPGSGNKEFNFAQVTKGQVNSKSFPKPEVLVRVKCDVHPWMFAYIGVCEHPYWAVTDKDGSFKIAGLPPGKYTLEAFHLKAGAKSQEITVADDKKDLEFTLDVPAQ